MHFAANTSAFVMLSAVACALAGCPMDDDSNAGTADAGVTQDGAPDASAPPADANATDALASAVPTHTGLVSIQDITIENLPGAGHGLTVNAFFTPLVAADFSESADSITGCRAWSYDLATKPPPPEQDHGELRIDGANHGALACRFVAQRGYVCPTATGNASVTLGAPSGATVAVTVPGGTFSANDVGRYLSLTGASNAGNNGASAIVAIASASEVVVANPRAAAETFAGTWSVIAGAGPTPNDLYEPFVDGTKVTVGLVPSASAALAIPDTAITPGSDFVLDDASKARITTIPVTGEAITFRCATCGPADGTIVRITATDADVTNASPVAMPPPKKKLVEIQCLRTGAGAESVTVPAAAMDLIRAAHAVSPITRIRTAFMRDGLALTTAQAPLPPNPTYVVSGHGVLGFTKP